MSAPISVGGPVCVGGEVCRDFARSSKLEWLETNGTGAFANGTVAGVNTRRYHALLTASFNPPAGRRVLLARVEEEALLDGGWYALGTLSVSVDGYRAARLRVYPRVPARALCNLGVWRGRRADRKAGLPGGGPPGGGGALSR